MRKASSCSGALIVRPISSRSFAQAFHLLTQAMDLLDQAMVLSDHLLLFNEFITLYLLLSQDLILFSHMIEFFFSRHALTLLGLSSFGEPPEELGCHKESKFFVLFE